MLIVCVYFFKFSFPQRARSVNLPVNFQTLRPIYNVVYAQGPFDNKFYLSGELTLKIFKYIKYHQICFILSQIPAFSNPQHVEHHNSTLWHTSNQ